MTDVLDDLYQQVILDHARAPRNHRRPPAPTCSAHADNPLCGDEVAVFLTLDATDRIGDAAFQGRGCAIMMASASLLTEVAVGRTEAEARRLSEAVALFCSATSADSEPEPPTDVDALQRLAVLSGVRAFPVRQRCATLPWQALAAALDARSDAIARADRGRPPPAEASGDRPEDQPSVSRV